MVSYLIGLVFVTFAFFSPSLFAAKSQVKTKKTVAGAASPLSLVQQAQQAIAVDPNAKVVHSSSPQETGILVMRARPLSDDRYPTRYPVGLHLDSYSLSGQAVSANNMTYNFSDSGSPLVPSLRLGLVPLMPLVFDGYYVQLGYQQRQISTDVSQNLKLSHYTASFACENKFYTHGKMDLYYQVELGLLQSQISSKENSLSNITRKASFLGLGLQTRYNVHNSLSADVSISYRNTVVKSDDYNLQPLGVGAGISYIW